MTSMHRRNPTRSWPASRPALSATLILYAFHALAAGAALGFSACGPEFTAAPLDATGAGGGVGGCSGGQVACQGACVDLATDVEHCGACDTACPTEDGAPVCSGGTCQPQACPENYDECDGDISTPCETNLSSDPESCGACGQHCGGRCEQGACIKPVQVTAGANYTCARLADHTVWCWGKNDWGNLGNGAMDLDEPTPTKVVGLDGGATQIAAGSSSSRSHTCALRTNGAVACWGAGTNGQLGDGTLQTSPIPVSATLPPGTVVRQVVTGGTHSCALTLTNRLYCWGDGGHGQVGNSQLDNAPSPVLILDNVATMSAGGEHTCAALNDGTLQCWGDNQWGQLGNGTFQAAHQPAFTNLDKVGLVTLGFYHSCARTSDPLTVRCWGRGLDYRLGTSADDDTAEPLEVMGLSDTSQLALGNKHSGVVLKSGAVAMWGGNASGQLGNGMQATVSAPQLIDLADVASLSLGDDHSCALTIRGDVLCWGDNTDGELGDGTMTPHRVPAPVVWQKPLGRR